MSEFQKRLVRALAGEQVLTEEERARVKRFAEVSNEDTGEIIENPTIADGFLGSFGQLS